VTRCTIARPSAPLGSSAVLWSLLLPGCIASNVIAPTERLVVGERAELAWRPADAAAVPGYFVAVELEGEAAQALRAVAYVFTTNGRYTGAALVEGDDGLDFQTLRGEWRLGAEGLSLDAAAPVACEQAPGHLRLTAPNGVVVLRREELR
jgi:hypothetical protein